MSLPRIDPFKLVYWVIAIATAQHTAWGAATTMQGAQPIDSVALAGWWLQGLAFAAGIDFLMVMVATKIRTGATDKIAWYRNWYIVTFAVVAIVSFYFQLVYAWQHATPLTTSGGVSGEWLTRLQGIIDARIVVAPMALPLVATFYTLGGLGKGGEVQKVARSVVAPMQRERNVSASALQIETQAAPQLPSGFVQGFEQRDAKGNLFGYICPGCNKTLSVSGWSRHKRTCPALRMGSAAVTEYSANGHEHHD